MFESCRDRQRLKLEKPSRILDLSHFFISFSHASVGWLFDSACYTQYWRLRGVLSIPRNTKVVAARFAAGNTASTVASTMTAVTALAREVADDDWLPAHVLICPT